MKKTRRKKRTGKNLFSIQCLTCGAVRGEKKIAMQLREIPPFLTFICEECKTEEIFIDWGESRNSYQFINDLGDV